MFLHVLLLSIIIYFSIIWYYKIYHPFWYKQPVDFIFSLETDEGKIGLLEDLHKYNPDFICTTWNQPQEILSFLNNHFQPGGFVFNYNINHIDSCYFFKIINIQTKEICGCISTKPISSVISNIKKTIWYVDHLVVKKKWNGKGLATDLISSIIDTIGDQIYLFKKDISPLPFKYFCKYKYFEVQNKSTNILPQELSDKTKIYQKIYQQISRNKRISIQDISNKNLIFLEKNNKLAIVYYTNMLCNNTPVYEIGYAETRELAQLSVNYILQKYPEAKILVNNLNNTDTLLETKYLSENYLYFYNYRIETQDPENIFLTIP